MIHYSECPVCKDNQIHLAFSAKDNTVSFKTFTIWKCDKCSLLFTQDVPGQDEIGTFYASENYISHSDTRKGVINSLYHTIRKHTLSTKLKLVKSETGLTQGNILDIGCGTGAFLNTMKTAGWGITGLEPDENARAKANATYHLNAMPSAELFNLPAGSFNAITMWHVLEHVHQLHEYVSQLRQLLSEKGKIFIAVPNYTSYDAAHYKEHWAAYDVPRHLYHFSPQSMKALMNAHGLQVIKMKPMWFDSFYVSMLSEQYKNGRGNMISACWNGLVSNSKTLFNTEKCSSVIYIISK
ncbi:MAG: class I SAM-dependent methyltransferase [Ferruginibacter sp.]|nr:class I SAM-dependent methyltransferase [Ferruginibacter sp.]